MIDQFLAAAEIESVIWIDDFFAPPTREQAADAINKHLGAAKTRALNIAGVAQLATIDLQRPQTEIEEAVEVILTEFGTDVVLQIEEQLRAITGLPREPGPEPDLSDADFAALQAAFGQRLTTFSANRWMSEGVAQYGADGRVILFIIDREFSREGTGYNGLDFLTDLTQRPNSYCIVLTHTCTAANQNSCRTDFAGTRIDAHRFCVLSKQQDAGLDVDRRFGRAIFEVYAHLLTGELAGHLADAISKATEKSAAEISSESIYDIDKAIFENSIAEGTAELEVILRIMRARQKPAVAARVQTAAVQSTLQRIRKFRTATLSLRAQLPAPTLNLSTFRTWRRDEVFEDAAAFNALHFPLACGDLFTATLPGGGTKDYILLAQPCALSVRGDNGKRTGEVGMLVPVGEKPQMPARAARATGDPDPDDEDSPYKFFDVKGALVNGQVWRVDLRYTMYCPLRLLDLAVFNADGSVKVIRNHPEPAVVLPDGWRKKFSDARGWFKPFPEGTPPARWPKPDAVIPKPIGKGSGNIIQTLDGSTMAYNLRRSGRITSNMADAIYAAWGVFQTRGAFDHDFAKLTKPEDGPEEPPARPVA